MLDPSAGGVVSATQLVGRPFRSGAAITDAQGVLRTGGLPKGNFLWRAQGPHGTVLEGHVLVPPHDEGLLEIAFLD